MDHSPQQFSRSILKENVHAIVHVGEMQTGVSKGRIQLKSIPEFHNPLSAFSRNGDNRILSLKTVL
jgi:hypothetical protein